MDNLEIIADDGSFDEACDALYASAFGPGRHAKAAAHLRQGNVCRRDVSFLALQNSTLVGACRLWPIVGEHDVEALFLGPIAVDDGVRSLGIGGKLVSACLAAVDQVSPVGIVLVGDLAFFAQFGFTTSQNDKIALQWPVDPKRILIRPAVDSRVLKPTGLLTAPCL